MKQKLNAKNATDDFQNIRIVHALQVVSFYVGAFSPAKYTRRTSHTNVFKVKDKATKVIEANMSIHYICLFVSLLNV